MAIFPIKRRANEQKGEGFFAPTSYFSLWKRKR